MFLLGIYFSLNSTHQNSGEVIVAILVHGRHMMTVIVALYKTMTNEMNISLNM